MKRKTAYLLGAAAGAIALSGAQASDTTTYTYDALGRLVAVSTSGGPNDGLNVTTGYDPAGNRSSYAAGVGGAPPPPAPPPPPPPPPPANQPPVANPDSLTAPKCSSTTANVIANDTDPEGHYPLTLTSVSGDGASIASNTHVGVVTPANNGTYQITYTVADSLGATSSGTLTVTVTGQGQCL